MEGATKGLLLFVVISGKQTHSNGLIERNLGMKNKVSGELLLGDAERQLGKHT